MQQNYINPETCPLPDIASVKRSLEFKNYLYNRQQLQRKSEFVKRQKMQEIHKSALEHERTLIDIENQKLYQLHKKHQAQQALKNAYDTQIYSRQRYKTEQKSHDRLYDQNQKELLQNQQRSRINDMSKIYNIGSSQKQRTNYFPNKKILTQGCEDSLDHLKYQGFPEINQLQLSNSPHMQQHTDSLKQSSNMQPPKFSFSSVDQPSLQNSRTKKYSAVSLEYAEYLKNQIQRKQKTKDQQKRRQLQKDKTWIETQNRSYSQRMQEMNYLNQKKKYDYAAGLEKQLLWKKQYFNRL